MQIEAAKIAGAPDFAKVPGAVLRFDRQNAQQYGQLFEKLPVAPAATPLTP